VAHYMEGGILPGDQVAVVPDFRGYLNRHEGLNCSFDRAQDGYNSGYRESRQRVTAGFGFTWGRGVTESAINWDGLSRPLAGFERRFWLMD
jgi:hypothetical protein